MKGLIISAAVALTLSCSTPALATPECSNKELLVNSLIAFVNRLAVEEFDKAYGRKDENYQQNLENLKFELAEEEVYWKRSAQTLRDDSALITGYSFILDAGPEGRGMECQDGLAQIDCSLNAKVKWPRCWVE